MKTLIKKYKKNLDKTVSLAKSKLYSIEVLICKVLTNSNIINVGSFSINNVLKEHEDTKEEIRDSNGI